MIRSAILGRLICRLLRILARGVVLGCVIRVIIGR